MKCLRHQIKNYKESPEKQARHTDKNQRSTNNTSQQSSPIYIKIKNLK
jgi:hypothetical protein